jgi:hypothetical protein
MVLFATTIGEDKVVACVLVKTNQSMDGFLLTLFFSSKTLEESDQRWPENLKAAAEQ